VEFFDLKFKQRIPYYDHGQPQFAIANFLHTHFKGNALNYDFNMTFYPEKLAMIFKKYTTTKKKKKWKTKMKSESTSQSILLDTTGTQQDINKWEYVNFDRSEVMVAVRPTKKQAHLCPQLSTKLTIILIRPMTRRNITWQAVTSWSTGVSMSTWYQHWQGRSLPFQPRVLCLKVFSLAPDWSSWKVECYLTQTVQKNWSSASKTTAVLRA